ncbi:MAG: mitochondrial fission ELM1 family protein [Pseudomonadota bacterium]
MTESPASLGPSIWAVSDGRDGNAAQVRAIAKALNETQRWMRIAHIRGEGHRKDALTLTAPAPFAWLPSKWNGLARASLPIDQKAALQKPWPTLWLGAGRRVARYSSDVRRWSDGQTLSVHVLAPDLPTDEFDLIVTPDHDEVSGKNVIRTIGSPAYFSADDIDEAGLAFADLADERGQSAIVVLGGHSKAHTFDKAAAERLEVHLRSVASAGWRLRITCSRRTPVPVRAHFRAVADQLGARFWEGPSDGPNPYLAWLAFSDAAIVTEDSANMLSDAAYFALPIHIARLTGRSKKFDRLHQGFIDSGCACWFHGDVKTWSYDPLREADRVADAIVEELLKRHPQPDIPSGDVVKPDWL